MTALLEVQDLGVQFYPGQSDRSFRALCSVNFTVDRAEILGLVGESGCGKSLTARSVLDLLPDSAVSTGEMVFDGRKYHFGRSNRKELRGRRVGLIFQEPMSALNPVFTVGSQLKETLRCLHRVEDEPDLSQKSLELLRRVHLQNAEKKLKKYPHQLSGGQLQRVMIALALAGNPDLLIADEPATALDAPLRREIIELLGELAGGGLSVLLITHNLALVKEICDRCVVMYSGYTVENCRLRGNQISAEHPYTQGLQRTANAVHKGVRSRLPVIEGEVPEPADRPSGCPFHPRCSEEIAPCSQRFPETVEAAAGRVACWARRD